MKVYIGNWPKNNDKPRKIDIRIDKWDTWSMDNTLAMIVHPMLVQLKATKHGAPIVDDNDVPENLRSTSAPPKENEWDTDDYHFLRWDWVLDEMIWAFEQLNLKDGWEEQYWIVHPELDLDHYPEDEGKNIIPVRWKVEGECDWDGMKAHSKRIDNGLLLFGKYFRSLWD